SEDPLTACMKCDAPVRKVLHPVGISFKGSGFYSTDYSGKTKTAEKPADLSKSDSSTSANGDSNGEKNGSGESSKKSESSPASKKG
ncbi:MAG: FmdB family zinc ribbon protein, partial [Rubrobacteraceae bacterium]